MKTFRMAVMMAAVVFTGLAGLVRADMTLTAAGVAEGLSLTTFATNFPTVGGVGPEGIAFPGNGVMVANGPGDVRVLPSHADEQNFGSVATNAFYGDGNAIGLAELNGKFYMTQRNLGTVLQVNSDGTSNQVIVTGLNPATGIVADPFTGHLYVSDYGGVSIREVDPVAKTAVEFKHVDADGLALSSDGRTLYVARDGLYIYGYDTVTKAQVFVSGLIGNLDGIALGNGTLAGKIFGNTNFGELWEVDLATTNQTLIANGGSRGDFVTADPTDGTLLVTQSDRILRLHPPAGGGFGSACVTPPAGLVSWWPGDGNADDIAGGNNGVLSNGTTFVTGLVAESFSFDGVSNFVAIAHNPNLNPTGAFSVDGWINANPVQFSADKLFLIVDKSHGWTDNTGWAFQGNTNGTVAFFFGIGGNTGPNTNFIGPSTQASVLDGQWHHLAGVYDGSQIAIYLDGALQNTVTTTNPPVNNTRDVHIGMSWGGGVPTRFFHGLVDEVEYFNRALSANEVAAIVAAGTAGKCKQANANNAPVANCRNVITNADANCVQDVPASAVNNNSSDPDGDPLTFSLSPAGPYAKGVTGVTLTVADNSGGTNTCEAMITVNDDTLPSIICSAGITTNLAAGVTNVVLDFSAPVTSDNCGTVTSFCVPSSGSAFGLGTNVVTCTAVDTSGNTNTCSFNIIVTSAAPNIPPNALCSNVTVSASAGCQAIVPALAVDAGSSDSDGSIASLSLSPPGPYSIGTNNVTLTVFDNQGASNSCDAQVIVVDTTPPVITCPGNITSNIAAGATESVVDFTVTVTDNCGVASTNCTPVSGSVFALGTTLVTCTAVDTSGNISSCTFTVTVTASACSCPDLTGTWSNLVQTCKTKKDELHCKVKGRLLVSNIGCVDVPTSFIRYYLSDDDEFDGGDTFLKQQATGTVKVGKPKKRTLAAQLPAGVNGSGKFIIAVIDADHTVTECNETNNVILFGQLP